MSSHLSTIDSISHPNETHDQSGLALGIRTIKESQILIFAGDGEQGAPFPYGLLYLYLLPLQTIDQTQSALICNINIPESHPSRVAKLRGCTNIISTRSIRAQAAQGQTPCTTGTLSSPTSGQAIAQIPSECHP